MNVLIFLLFLFTFGCQSKIEPLNPPLNGFYHKQLNYKGILIRAHKDVEDEALYEMARRIKRVTKHLPNVVKNLAVDNAPIHITGRNQNITDTPMWKHKKGTKTDDGEDFDKRRRAISCFTTFCSEEGLLLLPEYRFKDKRDIATHELNHMIMNYGIDVELMHKIEDHYEATMKKGLWKGSYASTNADEFFAETAMWYLGTNGDTFKMADKDQMLKKGPEPLKKYDPDTYKFLDDFFNGRMEVKLFKREVLEMVKDTRSTFKDGDRRVHLLFENTKDTAVEVFWQDYEGKLIPDGKITANSQYGKGTYPGHIWVVKDEKGKEIGRYKMSRKPAKVIIK